MVVVAQVAADQRTAAFASGTWRVPGAAFGKPLSAACSSATWLAPEPPLACDW